MTRFATRAVHAGLEPDPSFGDVIPAIHQSTTYVQSAPGEFRERFDYSRSANPTRDALERGLGDLEGGLGSAFSSGMAATHALITAVCSAGDHVVIPDDLYGGTYRLVDKVLTRWGLTYTMVDQTDLDAVAAAVRDETKLIWVETPTNPTLKVIDVPGVIARAQGRFVVVDNTFATPVYQRPLELGADAVVHSATKYLGGHSDAVSGAVVVRDEDIHERCASCRTRSVPCRGRSIASSCTVACARCTCGWRRTPRTRAWSRRGWRRSTAPTTCAGPGSPGWSRSGIPTRRGS